MMTSSTNAGSRLLRLAMAFRASAARSTGCQFFSFPLRLPPGVRTASTIRLSALLGLSSCAGSTHRRILPGSTASVAGVSERKNMDRWLGDGEWQSSAIGGAFENYGVDGEDLGWVSGSFRPTQLACNPHGTVQPACTRFS